MAPQVAGMSPEPCPGKGAISQLQEFVQGSKRFPLPPSCPILQWNYDMRQADGSLDFRATAAFLLDAVPHHVAGAWRPSKKLAQREVAESALVFFVRRWGELAQLDAQTPQQEESACDNLSFSATTSPSNPWFLSADETATYPYGEHSLSEFCTELATVARGEVAPDWAGVLATRSFNIGWDSSNDLCRALVQVDILGVQHTFPGKAYAMKEEALNDVAKRVLWYLQWPGFEHMFEPDSEAIRTTAVEIPGPLTAWVKDGTPAPVAGGRRDRQASRHQLGAAAATTTGASFVRGARKAHVQQRSEGAALHRRRGFEGPPLLGGSVQF